MGKSNNPAVFISAKEKENIDELKRILYDKVKVIHTQRFPFDDFLYDITWRRKSKIDSFYSS